MNAPVIPPLSLPTAWWEWLILLFGAYRLVRLAGWDDWPPIVRVRAWVIGERWVMPTWQHNLAVMPDLAQHEGEPVDSDDEPSYVEMPGKTPGSEVEGVEARYDRPVLAHLFRCPFCLGWWVSLAVYIAWLLEPRPTLYALSPFALSGLVGLVAKNLDP